MKFKIREGYVARVQALVETSNGAAIQESLAYPGTVLELTPLQAQQHAHQTEPVDDEARAWHDDKVLKISPSASTAPPLSEEQMRTIAAMLAAQLAGTGQPAQAKG